MPRIVVTLFLLFAAVPAWAVFEVEMPLETLVAKSDLIGLVKVEKLDREKERCTLTVERLLKGSGVERLPVKLKGDGDGHPLDMLARIEKGTTLVVFIAHVSPTDEIIFAYTEGSWFKLSGKPNGSIIVGQFVQAEPYLRKTYGGSVDELVKLLAGSGKLPEIDKNAKPGLGKTLIDLPKAPDVATNPSAAFELSPAWKGDETQHPDSSARDMRSYLVAAFLCIAGIGLIFLLSRSTSGGPAT